MRTIACLCVLPFLLSCTPRSDVPPEWDFTGPHAAVATFIKACADRNADLLAMCIADAAAGEFRSLREGTAKKSQMDELQMMFRGAIITKVNPMAEDRARVDVALNWKGRKREQIYLVKEGGDWKIQDF
ncbi:MAG: nuclear transport factor 2 family protein [Planctomycetota bacterium]|jgi:hypothetical protein